MLFGVQLNDGYQRLGAEDGLIFGYRPGRVKRLPHSARHVLRRVQGAGAAPRPAAEACGG